jgi:ABC-type transport system involved in cytochrome c biogenesis permease subunit
MIVWTVLLFYILTGIGFIAYLFWRKPRIVLISRGLYLVSIALHVVLTLSLGGQMNHIPLASPFQAANMMILLASLVFTIFLFRKSTAVLGAFFLPIAGFSLGMIAPRLLAANSTVPVLSKAWYPLHTMSVIAGEALFTVSFVVSIVYLVHERIIRKGYIHWTASSLPPLKLLDRILSSSLGAGFISITAGMLFGALWASSLGVSLSHIAVKASAGAAMWMVFAFSLHQRFAIRWSGRRTAVITIAGFLFMVLLFIGMNMVYPDAHGVGLTG